MGVFDDKRYDQLDWVSQAVQPIETPLATLLEQLPDKTPVPWDWFRDGTLDLSDVIQELVSTKIKGRLSYQERAIIDECFEFQCSKDQITLNLGLGNMDGEIHVVKTKFTLDEDRLKQSLGEEGLQYLGQMNYYNMDFPRANEMLELLEKTEEALKSRSGRNKSHAIRTRLTDIFKNNEWNVKSTELANKMGYWIRDYVDKGNLAALSNITRLKVMTYKGGPIYSIEEA